MYVMSSFKFEFSIMVDSFGPFSPVLLDAGIVAVVA